MKLTITDKKTGGDLILVKDEPCLDHLFYSRDQGKKYFTIAWNKGPKQTVSIDGESFGLETNTLLPLMFNQSFDFERSADIVAWRFNREFYRVIDHDAEVSCVGFLFGMGDKLFINLGEPAQGRLQLLLEIFIHELNTPDHIQADMLVMLLKRLIIIVTGIAKSSYVPDPGLRDERMDIFRKFNLLVEANYFKEHSVQFYADALHKYAKTLANTFLLYNRKTPLQMIQERIIIEAKRLLSYTDKPVKQITYELGFEDPAYFSNFFKRHVQLSPADFRVGK